MQSDKYSNKSLNKFRPKSSIESDLDREIEEALGGKSIEELIETEDKATSGVSAKGVKTGTVIDVDGDDVLVDLGGKSQGVLPLIQFEGQGVPHAGDTVEVTIQGYDRADGCLILSKIGAVLAADWGNLEEGHIVEGKVTGHNKGGLEIDLSGIRAFMPISQIEMFRVEDIAQYVNQRLRCQVIELDQENNNVIVSRRALLELEAAAAREKAWENLQEGLIVSGVVRNIMPYGAFVDIGGVDGLLHVGDMAHSRVEDPKTVVTEGQQLKVKILKIDRQTRKVSLGLKQVMPDPWDTVEVNFAVDSIQAGRVTKLMDFGAFVELAPGVEGLVPISEMSFERRIGHPKEIFSAGDMVKVRILKIDRPAKRISLSIKRVGADPWMGASARWPQGSLVEGHVTRLADFGAFVEVSAGVEGLVHISELSHQRVRGASDAVRVGQAVQAKVLSVDEEARRMSLSIKQAAEAAAMQNTAQGSGDTPAGEPAEGQKPPKKRKTPLKGGLD